MAPGFIGSCFLDLVVERLDVGIAQGRADSRGIGEKQLGILDHMLERGNFGLGIYDFRRRSLCKYRSPAGRNSQVHGSSPATSLVRGTNIRRQSPNQCDLV